MRLKKYGGNYMRKYIVEYLHNNGIKDLWYTIDTDLLVDAIREFHGNRICTSNKKVIVEYFNILLRAGKINLAIKPKKNKITKQKSKIKKSNSPSLVKSNSPSFVKSDDFLQSYEWRKIRYDALKLNDGRCELCGRSKKDGIILNVDHIKPRKTHPQLALTLSNLQVLCGECNHGKGNRDSTDWR